MIFFLLFQAAVLALLEELDEDARCCCICQTREIELQLVYF